MKSARSLGRFAKSAGSEARGLVVVADDVDRTRVLALFALIAIDELDHRQRGIVAIAIASLEHADIATLAGLVARTEGSEELADLVIVAHSADGDAAGVQ